MPMPQQKSETWEEAYPQHSSTVMDLLMKKTKPHSHYVIEDWTRHLKGLKYIAT
jgi:hypothetical protein